ncbi:MAG: isochorismate synthase [Bacteriovorax sp.]|jgi:menaquinone-specific isochorismate synthase
MKTERFLKEELQKIHSTLKTSLNNDDQSIFRFQYDEIDTCELLNHVTCEKIFYFKSKYGDFSCLGLGHSETVKSRELNDFTKKYPDLFLTAAFSFEENALDTEFILPEWIFIRRDGITELTINKSYEYKNFSTPNLFFNSSFDLNLYDPFIPPWQSYEEHPEHDQWAEMIKAADQQFLNGELQKIVLSRKKIFGYECPVEPMAFFKAAMAQNNFAQSSYAIFNQINFGETFISLTPEKFFTIKDQSFESISLAASAPRGVTEQEDAVYEESLNTSEKLVREHNIVTEEIVKKIKTISTELIVSPLQTMKLPYIQHRSVPIAAKLNPGITALDLVVLLHPTPAVGGIPWDKARNKILELEPGPRKYYAAPIGVISEHYSEMAVGIRAALIEAAKITLYGGAGIVSGSTAEEEWLETGIKMNPYLKVVNHE